MKTKKFLFKSVFLSLSMSLGCSYVFALPTDGSVVSGNASISSPSANSIEIHQSTDKAIINWRDFSIGNGESAQFFVPGSNSATLNRVTGGNISQILGSLKSNGQLWLINQNGIMFGPNAQVNAAGFTASTLDITDDNFLKGNYNLTQSRMNLAKIVNEGSISAEPNGFVALIAPQVENHGIISATLGAVAIGAGQEATLQLEANRLLSFSVQNGANVPMYDENGNSVAAITHTGEIHANGGQVILNAQSINTLLDQSINVSGVVTANTFSTQPGKIMFIAAGDTLLTGNAVVHAQGVNTGESGGSVYVLGNRVGLLDNAMINVNGAAGGGTVLIGGDYQGSNPDIQNAEYTYIGPNASVMANAIDNGNGGKVIAWANQGTQFYGHIEAQGGANGGNGGFVETSGKQSLNVAGGRVNTLAQNGQVGTWLLDPTDVTIESGSASNGSFAAGNFSFSPANPNSANVNVNDILTALNTSNVQISTSSSGSGTGNIEIATNIAYTGGVARTLTLTADGSITLDSGVAISDSSGSLSLTFNSANAITLAGGSSINVNGIVNMTANTTTSNTGVLTSAGTIQAHGANITLANNSTAFSTGTAAINLTGSSSGQGVIGGGAVNITTASGDIQQTDTSGNSTTIQAGSGAPALNLTLASAGNITQSTAAGINLSTGSSTLTATAGSIGASPAGTINLSGQNNNMPGTSTINLKGNDTSNPTALAFSLYDTATTLPLLVLTANGGSQTPKYSSLSLTAPNNTESSASIETKIGTLSSAKISSLSNFDLTLNFAGNTNTLTLGISGLVGTIQLPNILHDLTVISGGGTGGVALNIDSLGASLTANNIDLETAGSAGISIAPGTGSTITASNTLTAKSTGSGNVAINQTSSGPVYAPTVNVEVDGGNLILNNVSSGSGAGDIALNVTDTSTGIGSFTNGATASTFNTFTLTANNFTGTKTSLEAFLFPVFNNLTSGTTANVTLGLNSYTSALDFTDVGFPSSLSLNNLSVTTAGNINLNTLTAGGTLTADSHVGNGNITQSGILTVAGTTTLNSGTGAITLDNTNNDFSTVAITNAGNVTLTDLNALILAASTVGGTFNVNTDGTVTQTGALSVTGGVMTIAAGLNDVTLDNASNDFSTVAITSGNNITLTDINALILGASTVTSNLNVTTSGAVTQSGALAVATGTTTIAAGSANNITLNNASNDFGTVAITSGNNVTLTDANALFFGASTVSGTLGVTTNGDIGQFGAVTVANTTTLAAGTGAVTLDNASNDFNDITVSSAGNTALSDANGMTINSATTTGTFTASANNNSANTGVLTVAGNIASGSNTVSLVNYSTGIGSSANAINLTGGTITSGALNIGVVSGKVNQTNGIIHANGLTTIQNFGAGGTDVSLSNSSNDFGDVTATNVGLFSLTDINELGVSGITASGPVTILAQNGILSFTGAGPAISLTGGVNNSTITLVAMQFNNTTSGTSSPIDLGSGTGNAWNFYLTNLSANIFDSGSNVLTSGNQAIWGTTYPTAISATGNRYIFGTAETLTAAPLATPFTVTKTYGDTVTLPTPAPTGASQNYQLSGFVDAATYGNIFTQDTASNVAINGLSYTSLGSDASAVVSGSPYVIRMTGTGTSTTGYAIAYNNLAEFGDLIVNASTNNGGSSSSNFVIQDYPVVSQSPALVSDQLIQNLPAMQNGQLATEIVKPESSGKSEVASNTTQSGKGVMLCHFDGITQARVCNFFGGQ